MKIVTKLIREIEYWHLHKCPKCGSEKYLPAGMRGTCGECGTFAESWYRNDLDEKDKRDFISRKVLEQDSKIEEVIHA